MSEPIEKLVQEVVARFVQSIRELPWYRKEQIEEPLPNDKQTDLVEEWGK